MLLFPASEHQFDLFLKVLDRSGKRFGFAAGIDDGHAMIFGVIAIAMRLFENRLVLLRCRNGVFQRRKQVLPVSAAIAGPITRYLERRQRKLMPCVVQPGESSRCGRFLQSCIMQRITGQAQVGFEFHEAWLVPAKNAGGEQVGQIRWLRDHERCLSEISWGR